VFRGISVELEERWFSRCGDEWNLSAAAVVVVGGGRRKQPASAIGGIGASSCIDRAVLSAI
jgi:hypothetical protein